VTITSHVSPCDDSQGTYHTMIFVCCAREHQ
jgi:hypothetical protein